VRAGQNALHGGQVAEAELEQLARDFGHCLLMQARITHDAALSHLLTPDFKLRFHQHEDVRPRAE
jgi:hypothetical protein